MVQEQGEGGLEEGGIGLGDRKPAWLSPIRTMGLWPLPDKRRPVHAHSTNWLLGACTNMLNKVCKLLSGYVCKKCQMTEVNELAGCTQAPTRKKKGSSNIQLLHVTLVQHN